MTPDITPFDDESTLVRIGDLEIENHIDRITLTGDLVITRDKSGLVLAQELLVLAQGIMAQLTVGELPDVVKLKDGDVVDNPF